MAKKLVDYWKYCRTCKHTYIPETEDPCNECLTIPVNEDSHKPTKYEEEEK